MTEQTDTAWHLDKRIPIALILALIVQTAGLVWWVSGLVHRLDTATEVNVRQDARLAAAETTISGAAIGAAVTTAQLQAVADDVTDLKAGQAEVIRLLRDSARGNQP